MYWGDVIAKGNGNKNGRSTTETNNKENLDKDQRIKPYKFDSIKKAEYLEQLRNGHTRGYAATLTGVGRQTIYDHIKKDKGFGAAISEAEDDAIAKVENALFEAANSGNVTAIQVFLYNRNPKRWADRRNIQVSGERGGPIEVSLSAKDLSDAELIAIIERGRRRRTTKKKKSS